MTWLAVMLLFVHSTAFAAESWGADPNEEDYLDMSIEELMDADVVVSGARRVQKVNELTVPVSVVTAEDIHYSGLTNIGEILQYTPGVDVIRFDRNRYAIGVRGLHDYASDRTLTLINGRIADSATFGGSEFHRQPILMEDIERIEVVRGPGGAAWGANAFTGVINIITKKPEDVIGVFGSTRIDEYGDTYSHFRVAEKDDEWSWRFSAGYEDSKPSKDCGAGGYSTTASATTQSLIGYSGYTANDFNRNWLFDTEAIYQHTEDTSLSFGAGYSSKEYGSYEFAGFNPEGNALMETIRTYARVDHEYDDGNSGYLQWFSNILQSRVPSFVGWQTVENDIEAQLNFSPLKGHKMSVGGNFRHIYINVDSQNVQDLHYSAGTIGEKMAGLFFMDSWEATDRVTLEGQVRGDWYSGSTYDWSTRVSALYSLDEEKDHVLRFSFAKAFRSPMYHLRSSKVSRINAGGGVYAFNLLESGKLSNEESWSLEGGYTGQLDKTLIVKGNLYYQRYEKMIGFLSMPVGSIQRYQSANIDGADSYGIELEIEKKTQYGKYSAWYAHNDFRTDRANQNLRSYAPAENKVGLAGRWFMSDGWTVNSNYRYTDITRPYSSTAKNIPASHRFDVSVSKKLCDGNGEFMLGVNDILNKTDGPNYQVGEIATHETPGRTFFVRLQMKF